VKSNTKWQAKCKGVHLGYHTMEAEAAQAFNVAAESRGVALNVIPPVGAADDGVGAGTDWREAHKAHGGGRWPQACCTEDTGDSRVEQEDEARCSDDIGGSRAEQEALGHLGGRGGRNKRHHNSVVSEFG
jgi:hypothetical protein